MGLSEGDLGRSGLNRGGQTPSTSLKGTAPVALTLALPDTGPKGDAVRRKNRGPGSGISLRKEKEHV